MKLGKLVTPVRFSLPRKQSNILVPILLVKDKGGCEKSSWFSSVNYCSNKPTCICLSIYVAYILEINFTYCTWIRIWLPLFTRNVDRKKLRTNVGIISHTLGLRYLTFSEPWLTLLIFGRQESDQFLRSYWFWYLRMNAISIFCNYILNKGIFHLA